MVSIVSTVALFDSDPSVLVCGDRHFSISPYALIYPVITIFIMYVIFKTLSYCKSYLQFLSFVLSQLSAFADESEKWKKIGTKKSPGVDAVPKKEVDLV